MPMIVVLHIPLGVQYPAHYRGPIPIILCSFAVVGVQHNIPILRDIITQPRFVSGDITTNFMAEVYPEGFPGGFLCVMLVIWC